VSVADTTLYLFDGHNLLYAGSFADERQLVDSLASYVAGRGARGVVVFDGGGEERDIGPLAVRYAAHADDVLERLAAENRDDEQVCLVSSDAVVRRVSGQEVRKISSRAFLDELAPEEHREHEQRGSGSRLRDRLDEETRERLERLRRGS
jgi:predicted RNA-binding protein with PIN domain